MLNASSESGRKVARWKRKDDEIMPRVDYLNDPSAPRANSIVPAVSAIVTNEAGSILLILRTDNGYWSIPGGGVEPGETLKEATAREVREETGIDCEVTRLVGIYSDPHHVAAYADGEVRQEFSICFTTRILGGEISTSDESAEVRFVNPDDIPDLHMHPSTRLRIDHYLERRPEPYIG
jgi:ADP-ribose pyrophosphatase YjhB (NUDIX family)